MPSKRKCKHRRNAFKDQVFVMMDRVCCYICDKPLDRHDATVDHFVPLRKGGSDELGNYEIACEQCNVEKGNFVGWFYDEKRKQNQVPYEIRWSNQMLKAMRMDG